MKKEPLPVPGPWEVRQLGREFLPVVVGHYHSYPNPKYLGERLDAGVMHGAFEGEELLGFIGMHSEGSVGLLEVLPAHRRRGVASALLAYMTNWCLERGWTPFSQIYEGNTASEGLHQKLRWELSRQQLFWVMDDKKGGDFPSFFDGVLDSADNGPPQQQPGNSRKRSCGQHPASHQAEGVGNNGIHQRFQIVGAEGAKLLPEQECIQGFYSGKPKHQKDPACCAYYHPQVNGQPVKQADDTVAQR